MNPGKVVKRQEGLDVFDRLGGVTWEDGYQFLGVHGHAVRGDNKSQELSFRNVELALLGLADNRDLLKLGKTCPNVRNVYFLAVAVDQNVIDVDDRKQVKVFSEGIVHEVLECCRGVREAEGHHQILE